MPQTRDEQISEAVARFGEVMVDSLDASGACPEAAFAWLGAVLVQAAGVALIRRFLTPDRKDMEPFDLNEAEQAIAFKLMDDAHHNAKDRLIELLRYHEARRASHH